MARGRFFWKLKSFIFRFQLLWNSICINFSHCDRPRKDHFKNDLRSDQDHLLKNDLRIKVIFFQRNDQKDLDHRLFFAPKVLFFEGQNINTDTQKTAKILKSH
jgi:hypothetical protein